jgi:FkbM family methyltransferase
VPTASLARELLGRGWARVFSTVEAATWLGERGVAFEHYWLTSDTDLYAREHAAIARVEELLADPASVELYQALIRYRTAGDWRGLPAALPLEEQYFAPDLIDRIDCSRLVDCGAYDGDTLLSLADRGLSADWIMALEPDPDNYTKLLATRDRTRLPAVCLPVGAWSRSELLRFSADGTAAAAVSEAGLLTIQAVALDEILPPAWVPTYVKMDIEGAELEALAGAVRCVRSPHVAWAVSAYHRPADLWSIPSWMEDAAPNTYDMYLRQYGENLFDTVLYCIPRS